MSAQRKQDTFDLVLSLWTCFGYFEWILVRKCRSKTFKFHHTIYSAQELVDRIAEAGFKRIKVYGSLDGDEYGPEARRLIVVGSKDPPTGLEPASM